MKDLLSSFLNFFRPDVQADTVVPPTGYTVWLTLFSAGAMAFLAVFALAMSLAAGRLADRWASELSQSSTVRVTAPADQLEAQTEAALQVLRTTPGVASVRPLTIDEQRALLTPWFGPELPLESLPIPRLIDVIETEEGYDAQGLRLRLQVEAPGAILDDHGRWRAPLVDAATRLRSLGSLAILLIAVVTAAMITLAANAALAANRQVIQVLRLVGARDSFIARVFVRRFTIRALTGAAIGTVFGGITVAALPGAGDTVLSGLALSGFQWLWLLIVPPSAGLVAFLATRTAASGVLRRLT